MLELNSINHSNFYYYEKVLEFDAIPKKLNEQ